MIATKARKSAPAQVIRLITPLMITGGVFTGPYTRDKAALFLQGAGQVLLLIGNYRIKERKCDR